ncbi:hypothetical protein IC582_019998 [Cucumis melo]
MDDTITNQSLELYKMKQILERLVQEYGSDISIDGKDADMLMTIRDISDSLSAKIQKETDLPQMITTLPLVSQPLALCELAPLDQTIQIVNEESQLETTKKQVEIQKNDEAVTLVEKEPVTVPDKDEQEKPIKRRKLCKIENKKVQDEDEQGNLLTTSTKIISESTIPVPDVEIREVDRYNPMWQVDPKLWKEYLQWKRSRKTNHEQRKVVSTTRKKDFFRQLEENTWVHGDTGINKPDCIVWNHIFDTHLVTLDNNKAEWTDPTTHLTIWTEKDVEEYYFNTAVGDYDQISGWGDVNYKLVDEALQMPARCIASLAIAIGVNLHSNHFTYDPWPIRRSKATLQKGCSLDCRIFCSKFVECLVTGSDPGCLTVPNMKLFRQQYVLELWANKYFW